VTPKANHGKYEFHGSVRGYIRYLKSRRVAGTLGDSDIYRERVRPLKTHADDKEMDVAERRRELVPIQAVIDVLQS
jgi:hypothetical protein